MRISVFAALSTVCLTLGGCGGDPDPVWQQAFGYVCSNHGGRGADVTCKTRPPEPENVSRYCYDTLGDPNCFDQPDEISKNQELGSSGK
ncbi:MAG: hypothetical protein AB7I36_12880 [Rhodospirillaceae bacterium]